MSLSAKVASALSFAHLAGLGRKSPKAAAEGDEKKDPDQDGGDGKKAKKADADEPDDDKKKKDDVSAEDDDPDSKASADGDGPGDGDGDGDGEDDKKKKAKADDGDDDSEDEMRGKSAAAQARRREQARCASIFASPAAARNPVLAANLAFKSRMGRSEALAILEATPAAAAAGHPERSARNPRVGAGAEAGETSQQAVASRWDRAFSKANPQKRG